MDTPITPDVAPAPTPAPANVPTSAETPPVAAPETMTTTTSMATGVFGNKEGQELAKATTSAEHQAVALVNRVRFHLSVMGAHDGALAEIKKDFVAFFQKLGL